MSANFGLDDCRLLLGRAGADVNMLEYLASMGLPVLTGLPVSAIGDPMLKVLLVQNLTWAHKWGAVGRPLPSSLGVLNGGLRVRVLRFSNASTMSESEVMRRVGSKTVTEEYHANLKVKRFDDVELRKLVQRKRIGEPFPILTEDLLGDNRTRHERVGEICLVQLHNEDGGGYAPEQGKVKVRTGIKACVDTDGFIRILTY